MRKKLDSKAWCHCPFTRKERERINWKTLPGGGEQTIMVGGTNDVVSWSAAHNYNNKHNFIIIIININYNYEYNKNKHKL